MDEQEAATWLEQDPAVRRLWAVTLADGIEVEVQRTAPTLVAKAGR